MTGYVSGIIVHTLLRAKDWQYRPEFDRVCDWWRAGGRGVFALVGMGGAGKTAIADQFLNALPGVLSDLGTVQSLPTPSGVFVYSFYEDDKPENFFPQLKMWQTTFGRSLRVYMSEINLSPILDPIKIYITLHRITFGVAETMSISFRRRGAGQRRNPDHCCVGGSLFNIDVQPIKCDGWWVGSWIHCVIASVCVGSFFEPTCIFGSRSRKCFEQASKFVMRYVANRIGRDRVVSQMLRN